MTVLPSLKSLILTVFDGPPEPAPKPDPKVVKAKAKAEAEAKPTARELRFSDLQINDPADALRALRRATRVPPHQRHLDQPIEDHMNSYSRHVDGTAAARPSETELRAVERNRRELRSQPAPRLNAKDSSAA